MGLGEKDAEENEFQDGAGDRVGAAGEGGAGDAAADELPVLLVLGRRTASNIPLLTRSSTASMAELFPTISLIPMCRR